MTALSSFIFGIPYIKKSAHTVTSLKYCHLMASFVQLICGCQSGRTGTHNCDFACRFLPSVDLPSSSHVHNAYSIIPCSFSLTETGSPFKLQVHAASHRAGQTRDVNSGKLFVFIRRSLCLFPVAVINQIIPFRYKVVQRTARYHTADHHTRLTKRYTAVHTSCALLLLHFTASEGYGIR